MREVVAKMSDGSVINLETPNGAEIANDGGLVFFKLSVSDKKAVYLNPDYVVTLEVDFIKDEIIP